ncbi:poly(A)-binding protein binding protein [Rhodotorula toruloides]
MAHTQQKRAVPGLGPSQVDSPAHDRFCWLLLALVGQTVTVTLKGGMRVRGILASSIPDSNDMSISLRQVVDLHAPPLTTPKPSLLINGRDLLEIEAADVALDLEGRSDASAQAASSSRERDSFRTDTDISGAALFGKERQLQAWGASSGGGLEDSLEGGVGGLEEDGLDRSTKGPARGRGWDQFAANERQFGLRTDYDDEIYTTKLDRSGADYKERERRAAQLEREIMKGGSALANNAHVAEERGEQLPEIENEEDRYGAVIRGEGAYVPPGARKAAAARVSQQQNGSPVPADKAAPSTPAGTSRLPQPTSATSRIPAVPSSGSSAASSTTTPSVPAPASVAAASASPAVAAPGAAAKPYQRSFQDFVTNERVRLEQKRAQMAQAQQQAQQQQQQALKKEQDSKLASLVQWSQTFKNPYPLSEDVAAIMGKKPGSNVSHDASKKPDSSVASNASPAVSPANTTRTLPAPAPTPSPTPSSASFPPQAAAPKFTKPLLPEIPPFNPARAKARQAELAAQRNGATAPPPAAAAPHTTPTATAADASASSSLKPKAPTTKLSAKSAAFVFKPNPTASSFTPGASSPASNAGAIPPAAVPAAAPAPAPAPAPVPQSANATPRKPAEPQAPPNPFFGNKVIKRGSSSMHVKEDFTPFKNGVLPEPSTVAPSWQFSGKPYRSIYPIPPQTAASAAASAVDDSASSIAGSLPGPGGIVDPNNAAAIAAAQAHAHAAAASGVPLGMMHPHQPHGPPPPHFPPQMAAALAASQGGPAPHISGGPVPPHVAGMPHHGAYNMYQMAAMAANANGGSIRGFPGQPGPGVPPHGGPHHPHSHPQQHPHHPGQMQHPQQHLMPGAGGPPIPPPPFAPQFMPGQGSHGAQIFPSPHMPPSSASASPHISHPSPAASNAQIPGQAGVGGPPGRYMPWTPAGFGPGQHGGPTPPPQNGPVPPHPGPPPQFVQQQQ